MNTLRTAAVALSLFPIACSGSTGRDSHAPPPVTSAGSDSIPPQDYEPLGGIDDACESGSIQECTVPLPEHNGVRGCFEGLQLCEDSVWGPCLEETDIEAELAAREL